MSELSHKRARLLIQQKQLSPEEHRSLAAHLVQCDECRRYAATHMYLSRNLHLETVRTRPAPAVRAAVLNQVQRQHRRNQIMSPLRAIAAVTVLAVILVLAWQTIGTAARQAEVSQPEVEAQEVVATEVLTGTPTEAPTRTPRPTLTPLPTRVQNSLGQVTTVEELAGVWAYSRGSIGYIYYQFNQDGTWSGAPTLKRLEDSPGIIGKFWFEGSRLNVNVAEDIIDLRCEDVVGVYEVQLLENGALRLELIEDECDERSEELSDKDLEPVELTE